MKKRTIHFLLAAVMVLSVSVCAGDAGRAKADGQKTITSFDISYTNLYDTETKTEHINTMDPKTVVAGGKINLDLADKYGSKNSGYKMTGGQGLLFATLNGSGRRKLEWSGNEDKFKDGSSEVYAPVMTAGKQNPWNMNSLPYFEVQFSTQGYEDITFSASIGATKKAPKSYQLAYRVGSSGNYSTLSGSSASVTLSNNKVYTRIQATLPDAAKNQAQVMVKIFATTSDTVGGGKLSDNLTGGKIGINHVSVQGSEIKNATSKPAQTTAAPTTATTKAGGQAASGLPKGKITKAVRKGKKLTVTVKKPAQVTGYQIKVGTDKKISKNVKKMSVTGKADTKKMKFRLKWKYKKCYVKVRAFRTEVSGERTYGKWSTVKKV